MHGVRPKKFLGQHFLKDQQVAQKIVDALSFEGENESIIEVGPGTGVLTNFLVQKSFKEIILIEIDRESIALLNKKFIAKNVNIIEGDILKINIEDISKSELSIIGNFPYNISSQIFFKILDQRTRVKEVVCMLQKEVAQRICASHGNKTYGILSVLIGAYYHSELLFNVPPEVFIPPPKVDSAIIRLRRKEQITLNYDEGLFKKIVKQGFQNRRKTLRNALKPIFLPLELTRDSIFDLRAEQLSVEDYIYLTQKIQNWKR
ncbi:MAG: 16S rRNA (adenine(1518)-N(6)/adenine(1519)-N(6))-dimethyltransferase RsmA [Cyclobacteriaceae bacterium]|nr:16S rRNA (adenine(1518)-N(6)/adenine(1519)-N(6))-dimethyltransferase RsmA [Cyclobacteriaceae bacterium]